MSLAGSVLSDAAHSQRNLLAEKMLQTGRDPGEVQEDQLPPFSLEEQSRVPLQQPCRRRSSCVPSLAACLIPAGVPVV